MNPRAVNPDGSLKAADDWVLSETRIKRGAALGANSTIRCGITVGEWAVIGAGSVVTRDVPPHGLVYGNPGRLHAFVCSCGSKLDKGRAEGTGTLATCPTCGRQFRISTEEWGMIK
jgi:acetyltransferase-like isoleucine patch superfamily enzyme